MGGVSSVRNIGALIRSFSGGMPDVQAWADGTTSDGDEISGGWVNRLDAESGLAMSALVSISYISSLLATNTLTLVSNMQDATSSTGAGAADMTDRDGTAFGTTGSVVAGTTASTGTVAFTSTYDYEVDLSGADQFIQLQFTPSCSGTTGGSSVNIAGMMTLGGYQNVPADA